MKVRANVCRIGFANTDVEVDIPDEDLRGLTDESKEALVKFFVEQKASDTLFPNEHASEYSLEYWKEVEINEEA